ncbi:unnamed protein product [Microthlaspi erraticum]|uniref:Uncharacterized protein n=1 Tax=Microthlaspi erraticum TaxID=1685480 RepID=A0A6D2ILX9_9BRAS|nr:unnamed protein product [Microthlaspi erraticum]
MPNMLSRLGMDTKELSFTDLIKVILCPTTTPKLFTIPSIITRHKQDTFFPRESYQAARLTKIEDMLQEYLRNQDESTKKMERRIDFIHESLGNKSEVLFKQVIKLDEDIKKLREDHDRSLTLVKLDVASKYQELLNKSMRIEDTSYGNSKHLGSIYNRLQALEGSSHANYKRERSPTPNHPPFYCNAITRRSTTQVHEGQ